MISLDLAQKLPDLPKDYARDVKEFAVDETEWKRYPSMNIVIMIVGSRGELAMSYPHPNLIFVFYVR